MLLRRDPPGEVRRHRAARPARAGSVADEQAAAPSWTAPCPARGRRAYLVVTLVSFACTFATRCFRTPVARNRAGTCTSLSPMGRRRALRRRAPADPLAVDSCTWPRQRWPSSSSAFHRRGRQRTPPRTLLYPAAAPILRHLPARRARLARARAPAPSDAPGPLLTRRAFEDSVDGDPARGARRAS